MALTPEDKKDVKTHLGKALANKVAKVTRDTDAMFHHPKTGKLHGRMEHTYKKDSFKGHKLAKKFGGAGFEGEQPTSKHVVDLSAKSKALQGKSGDEALNAWGQDAKTAKGIRKHLRQEKAMKAFQKGAGARHAAGY